MSSPEKGFATNENPKDVHFYKAADDAREEARKGIYLTEEEVEAEAERYRKQAQEKGEEMAQKVELSKLSCWSAQTKALDLSSVLV